VLRVIGSNPADLQVVFELLAETIRRLSNARGGFVAYVSGGYLRSWSTALKVFDEVPEHEWTVSTFIPALATREGRPIHVCGPIVDWEADYPDAAALQRSLGYTEAAVYATPIRSHGRSIGAVSAIRDSDMPFNERERSLLQTFADQAVIAIENARLFNELEERNREVSEALEQQTAMAEVLEVISRSPSNLQSVLDAIVERTASLTDSDSATVGFVRGDEVTGDACWAFGRKVRSITLETPDRFTGVTDPQWSMSATFTERRTVALHGGPEAILARYPRDASLFELLATRNTPPYGSVAYVPLLRESEIIGLLSVWRASPAAYSPRQISLFEAFADQAVIAIENARLFNELEESNRETQEALERQTAMAEVLEIISRSAWDAAPVLQAIADRAVPLCDADGSQIQLIEEDESWVEVRSTPEGEVTGLRAIGQRASTTGLLIGEVMERQTSVHFWGTKAEIEARWPASPGLYTHEGGLCWLGVPLTRGEEIVGCLQVFRLMPKPFEPQQVSLIEAFADQAVIAIENARLFNELQERNRDVSEALDQQTSVAGVLQAISRTAFDLSAVLDALTEQASKLVGNSFAVIQTRSGSSLNAVSAYPRGGAEAAQLLSIESPLDSQSLTALAVANRRTYAITIHPGDPRLEHVSPSEREFISGFGTFSAQYVPLLREDTALGALVSFVRGAHRFSERETALLQTFADQAVIAIENARLFNELQAKTEELEVVSRHKSEFLASMSHELRTPLNAIIGYAELLEEEAAEGGDDGYLPDLQKIHSAGQHLLTLISGILDLSKIEAGRMTMFLEDFDVGKLVGEVEAIVTPLVEKNGNRLVVECPADVGTMHADVVKVRQALFNLLSNAAKFTEGGTVTLRVGREGDDVRFAIADTGIGMTEEQMGRLFEAFSQANRETSRKYGGTGLGLALSREFCRMMGGDIMVESEAGVGSVFTIVLPVVVREMEEVEASAPRPEGSGA
jgi:signal transduction histidine kinase